MKCNGHARRQLREEQSSKDQAIEPIIVTKFERVAHADCDEVHGFFARDPYFVFEAFLNDMPGEDTYGDTRISEIQILVQGDKFPNYQWQWHSACREEPGWAFGDLLWADFRAGIEAAVKGRITDNLDYCETRIRSLVDQLLKTGLERAVISAAMAKNLEQTTPD